MKRDYSLNAPLLGAIMLAVFAPAKAGAEGLCEGMRSLVTAAQVNDPVAKAPKPFAAPATCEVLPTLGHPPIHQCYWKYGFRVVEATNSFNAFTETVDECLPDAVTLPPDQRVNHPDSYDLNSYSVGDVTLSISLKDKGALNATYVFLRAERD